MSWRACGLILALLCILALPCGGCSRYISLGQFASDASSDGGVIPGSCVALPARAGPTLRVGPAEAQSLVGIIAQASADTTILLEDGTYTMTGSESERRLRFTTSSITLASASGDPDKVILDGEYATGTIIKIEASDIAIANLTLRRAGDHLIHVSGDGGQPSSNALLVNLRLEDSGAQFVKINPGADATAVADNGAVECSTLRLTDVGRGYVDSRPTPCFTGGVDGLAARGWVVRDSRFEGIYCDNSSQAEHAIHFWQGSRDTLVERNVIVDCSRGIGFGLVESGPRRVYADDPGIGHLGHIDGIIRNNVIWASGAALAHYDTGIDLAQASGALVAHNTVPTVAVFSSIDYRFPNSSPVVRNNLAARITLRDGATGTVDHNLENTPTDLFVNPGAGDFHLLAAATAAIDQGVSIAQVEEDIDRQPRDLSPDLGADELDP
jgi:hypothetical protein